MRKTLLLVIFAFLLRVPIYAQVDSVYSYDLAKTFWVGSHLCRVPMPDLREMMADLENLKANGFNLVKIQTHWAIDEPLEGKYDFSRYEPIIARAGQLGMGVYLGLTVEQAPPWLYEKYPDCRSVGRNGLPIRYETFFTYPYDGKPGPCFYHPGVLEKQDQYLRAMVRDLGKYKNIVVWNTWQEIPIMNEFPPISMANSDLDFNPYVLDAFRGWLQKKYGSLDSLNTHWKTNFGDWKYVAPNRERSLPTPTEVDWRTFLSNDYVAQRLRTRYESIRRADPLKRPIFAHKVYPVAGSTQDWTYARASDFLGTSHYPTCCAFQGWDDRPKTTDQNLLKHASLLGEWVYEIGLKTDYIRSSTPDNQPAWSAEMQPGPIFADFHKGRAVGADDIRRWMLGAVAHGSNAICFWVTRAEIIASEENGFSLLDSEGATTPRFAEAGRIARMLTRYPDLFAASTKPKAKVALVVSERNYQFCASYSNAKAHLQYDIRGWYRLLWDAGIPVDFIPLSEVTATTAKTYKALIFPMPLAVAESEMAQLQAYVEQGGNLISEAAIGRFSADIFANRGELSPRARQLFGVRQASLESVSEPNGETRWSRNTKDWGENRPSSDLTGMGIMSGQSIRTNQYLQTFIPTEGTPVFMADKAVAGTVRSVGKGNAWLLGTFVGHSATAHQSPAVPQFVTKLLANCGVTPETVGKLMLRKRIGKEREAWLLLNPTSAAITETIPLPPGKRVSSLMGDKITRVPTGVSLTVNSLDVSVLLIE